MLDPKEYYVRNYADFNILHELANNYIDLNVADVKFQGELKWKAFKGFEASAQLFLRNASGTETAAADQTVTAAGIECTVPSTLTAGVYTVVVKQNGSWDLGPVRLEAAQNPVSSVVLPAAIKLNKTLEIAGNGFTSASWRPPMPPRPVRS